MISQPILLFLCLFVIVGFVAGHTNLVQLNGQKTCVRPPPNGQYDSPRKNIFDQTMVCNGNDRASTPCSVSAGSSITLKWHHDETGCIDPSHHGPITLWLSDDNGATWAKFYEEGFYGGGSSGNPGTWATDKLIARGCTLSVTVPQVRPGKYILRTELTAQHESFKQGGAQFYMGCADLQITGSGSCALSPKIRIPGHISSNADPSVFVDIYGGAGKLANYKPPGGALASCSGSGNPNPAPAPAPGPGPAPRPSTGRATTRPAPRPSPGRTTTRPSPRPSPGRTSRPSSRPASNTPTCGDGKRGNGVCADSQCCSKWGWCGDSEEHCKN